jgi:hypothetical protein
MSIFPLEGKALVHIASRILIHVDNKAGYRGRNESRKQLQNFTFISERALVAMNYNVPYHEVPVI